jgi:hypothetical protein
VSNFNLPTASTIYIRFLVISRRQWADFGPPKPEKTIPIAAIDKIKLTHFISF